MNERTVDDATHYRLLKLLEEHPGMSQRELAKSLGISLGKTNYCLRAVLARGHAKMVNFRNSNNRVSYLYQLTPSGLAAKLRVTRRFLALKKAEYLTLQQEIENLQREIDSGDAL
jgi:EPS-associated MarR family transcriptional regulator